MGDRENSRPLGEERVQLVEDQLSLLHVTQPRRGRRRLLQVHEAPTPRQAERLVIEITQGHRRQIGRRRISRWRLVDRHRPRDRGHVRAGTAAVTDHPSKDASANRSSSGGERQDPDESHHPEPHDKSDGRGAHGATGYRVADPARAAHALPTDSDDDTHHQRRGERPAQQQLSRAELQPRHRDTEAARRHGDGPPQGTLATARWLLAAARHNRRHPTGARCWSTGRRGHAAVP